MTFENRITTLCAFKHTRDMFITEWLRSYNLFGAMEASYWAKRLENLNDAQAEFVSAV